MSINNEDENDQIETKKEYQPRNIFESRQHQLMEMNCKEIEKHTSAWIVFNQKLIKSHPTSTNSDHDG